VFLAVTGAHYEVEERPPGLAVYQGSAGSTGGWVTAADPNQLTDKQLSDLIGEVHHQQLGKENSLISLGRCTTNIWVRKIV
jgi:hypothetical protein